MGKITPQPAKTKYFPLRGGMDLVTPPNEIHPGRLVDCYNYEIAPSGGYTPIDGFERDDGRGLPSAATFIIVSFSGGTAGLSPGAIVTGSASGATGYVLESPALISGSLSGGDAVGTVSIMPKGDIDFAAGDIIKVGTVQVAVAVSVFPRGYSLSDAEGIALKVAAVELQRSLVQRVPGSGPVRGVWLHKGIRYAFRDNLAGTACVMHKMTVNGWAVVPGVPALLPGGKYYFENNNFYAGADTINMYGCDGKNDAFEFDGATFTQIAGPSVPGQKPTQIKVHQKQLFLGYQGGQIFYSPVGNPLGTYTSVNGAGQIGIGDEITGWLSLPGGVLGIWAKDSIHILHGTSYLDYSLVVHTDQAGGIADTMQSAGRVLFLNEAGISELSTTETFGGFKAAAISRLIDKALRGKLDKVVSSVVVPVKDQYRVFFSDGTAITATYIGEEQGYQFSQSSYGKNITCIAAPKRADGEGRKTDIYFGDDDGFVYKMDSGYSMDETPMFCFARLPFYNLGVQSQKIRFMKAVLWLDATTISSISSIRFKPDLSLTDGDIPLHDYVEIGETSNIGAGVWNVSSWNLFYWAGSGGGGGGGGAGTVEGRIDAVATEMALLFYYQAPDTFTAPHTLNGVTLHYKFLAQRR